MATFDTVDLYQTLEAKRNLLKQQLDNIKADYDTVEAELSKVVALQSSIRRISDSTTYIDTL